MSLEQLWAGWRAHYVGTTNEPIPAGDADGDAAASSRCVFCELLDSAEPDEDRHLVFEGDCAAVVLNAFPYTSGHVLVLPRRHVAELEELTEEEAAALWEAMRDAVAAVRAAYRPDGINLGANLGKAAGAGIPGHLHLHVLPRWQGDTSFMTTVAGARVLPEALGDSWHKLRNAWPV